MHRRGSCQRIWLCSSVESISSIWSIRIGLWTAPTVLYLRKYATGQANKALSFHAGLCTRYSTVDVQSDGEFTDVRTVLGSFSDSIIEIRLFETTISDDESARWTCLSICRWRSWIELGMRSNVRSKPFVFSIEVKRIKHRRSSLWNAYVFLLWKEWVDVRILCTDWLVFTFYVRVTEGKKEGTNSSIHTPS